MASHAQDPAKKAYTGRQFVFPYIPRLLLGIVMIVAFAIVASTSALVVYGMSHSDNVYQGVSAGGIDLSGMTEEEARNHLSSELSAYVSQPIEFRENGDSRTFSLEEIGVEVDIDETVDRAYAAGRTGDIWSDSQVWVRSFVGGRDIDVVHNVETEQFRSVFSEVARDWSDPPGQPSFVLTEDGEVDVENAGEGRGIDQGATLREVRSRIASMSTDPVDVVMASVPPTVPESDIDRLQEQVQNIIAEPLKLTYEDRSWTIGSSALVGALAVDNSSDEATLTLRDSFVSQILSDLGGSIYQDGINASIQRDGNNIDVIPSEDGWMLDGTASAPKIKSALLNADATVELETDPVPAQIQTDDARETADEAEAIIDNGLTVSWDDEEHQFESTEIAELLSFEESSDGRHIELGIDETRIEQLLIDLEPEVLREPVDADLRYINETVEVRSEEENGQELDLQASIDAMTKALNERADTVELVTRELTPEVTADMAGEIEVPDMLSSGETYYPGSAPGRKHNVEHATQLANGSLIPPGGTYSFTEEIGGEISLDTGYQQGYGIVGTTDGSVETVPSVGGGVCQVSTTLFHAAFWAGMPMVERNWHLYWIPSYGQEPSGITGLDATVDTSYGLDFQFENTTDDWIAIVSSADGTTVRFEIWGTDPEWRVEVDDPEISNRRPASSEMQYQESDQLPAGSEIQVESAEDGFDVSIKRRVYDGDELIHDTSLDSTYRPSANVTLVGTGS